MDGCEYRLFRILLGGEDIHPVCNGFAAEIVLLNPAKLGCVDIKHNRFRIAQFVFGP